MNKRYRLGEIEEAVSDMEELIGLEDDIAEIDDDFQIVVSDWSVYVESMNCRFRTWGGTESFPSSNPRRPNCFLRTSNLENGSILSTALQCLTALPPLLPAHTESRLPPPPWH